MKKRYTLILMLAIVLVSAYVIAQNKHGSRRFMPDKLPITTECYEQAGVTQETLNAIDELRQLAAEQLMAAESRREKRTITRQLRADIKALFTEEQIEAIKECMKPDKPATCMDHIQLTPEQIEAIDSIRAAAIAAIKEAESFWEVRDIIELMHQSVEDVLTEEQLEDLRECRLAARSVNCMDQINLTEDQIAQIDAIHKAAIEAAKLATTREEIRAIMDKMGEDIMAVLTPEQIEYLNECRDDESEDLR